MDDTLSVDLDPMSRYLSLRVATYPTDIHIAFLQTFPTVEEIINYHHNTALILNNDVTNQVMLRDHL